MVCRAEIFVDGLNLQPMLQCISRQNITLYGVRRVDRLNAVIVVDYRNVSKVVDLLEKKCYNVQKIRYIGMSSVWETVKRHIAFVVAMVLLIPLLALLSGVCFDIHVEGADRQVVLDALGNYGVSVGRSLVGISYDKLENYLINTVGASFVTVSRRGSTLFVEVVPKNQADDPIDLDSPCDIVATRSGVVSRIVLVQGVAMVNVGDFVKEGQVLIKGERVFNDGTSQPVRAVGQVFATVECSYTEPFDGYIREYVRTGNVYRTTQVVLGKFTSSVNVPFEQFDVEQTTETLYPFGVTLIHSVYFEKVYQVKAADIDDCLEYLKVKALEGAEKKCDFAYNEVSYRVLDDCVTAILSGQLEIARSTDDRG